jgi:Rps23 Pro-64 3,4-dihydroxylase Tpa1-like proline 4-hydroxylase
MTKSVRVLPDVFDSELIDRASKHCVDLLGVQQPTWHTNYSWQKNNYTNDRMQSVILIHDLKYSDLELHSQIHDQVRQLCPGEKPTNILYHVWTRNANIEWHNDKTESRSSALTVYLNKTWLYEYGGDFLYLEGDNTQNLDHVKRITPQYNMGVHINDTHHRTLPVIGNRLRMCLQIWLTKDED